MAARENHGLQIALIIFAALTVILGGVTYWFFSQVQETTISLKKEQDRAKDLDEKYAKALEEVSNLKSFIGAELSEAVVPAEQGKESIQTRLENDLKTYGATLPKAKQNYRQLMIHLADARRAADQANEVSKGKIVELEGKLAADAKARVGELKKYTDQAAAETKDKDSERGKFNEDRDRFKTAADETKKVGEEGVQKVRTELAKATKDAQLLTVEINKLSTEKKDLVAQKEKVEQVAKAIDGKVAHVDQRQRLAWLNLGSDDGLRQQVSFTVLPADDSNAEAKEKARLEVTEVVGPHLATARILDDDPRDPVRKGDLVMSVAFEAGRHERFALAGFMDIDDDGQDDRGKVRSLIEQSGGVIDAELTDDGKIVGPGMTVNTHFLVLGESPSLKKLEKGDKASKGYGAMKESAADHGVQTLKVSELLRRIGYDATMRAVNLGKDARAEDFKPRFPGLPPKSTGTTSDSKGVKPELKKGAGKQDAKKSAY